MSQERPENRLNPEYIRKLIGEISEEERKLGHDSDEWPSRNAMLVREMMVSTVLGGEYREAIRSELMRREYLGMIKLAQQLLGFKNDVDKLVYEEKSEAIRWYNVRLS